MVECPICKKEGTVSRTTTGYSNNKRTNFVCTNGHTFTLENEKIKKKIKS